MNANQDLICQGNEKEARVLLCHVIEFLALARHGKHGAYANDPSLSLQAEDTIVDCLESLLADRAARLKKITAYSSDPVLAKLQAETEATPFYKRLAARVTESRITFGQSKN
jgi:hypothetical protein